MKERFLHSAAPLLLIIAVLAGLITGAGVSEASAAPPAHDPEPVQPVEAGETPLLGILSSYHYPITTPSEPAQRYFNQGLVMAYGFNDQKAVAFFKEALKYDRNCAMCYWGIAYALGPKINAPMNKAAVPEAYAAIQQAQAQAAQASPREQAYIQALAQRYSPEPVTDHLDLDLAYAKAMRQVAGQYPDDTEAATLFAEALMVLMPWNYWTKDGRPTEYTNEFVTTLESVLERYPNHPGANHFYIHAVEDSPTPERALLSAQRLETLVPGAMHLLHQPAQAYWLTDPYHEVYQINSEVIPVDKNTISRDTYPYYYSSALSTFRNRVF